MAVNFGRPPRRFTPVDLLRGHPLASGLSLFCFPGDGARDLVRGKIPISATGYATQATPYGPASRMATGAGSVLNYGTYNAILDTTKYTVAALSAPASVARATRVFLQGDNSPGLYSQISLMMNTNASQAATAGTWTLTQYSGGFQATSGCPVGIDGTYHLLSASRDGSNMTTFVDGVFIQLSGGASGSFSNATQVQLGGDLVTDAACDFPVVFVAAWSRALSTAEHLAFALNPWQLFRPQPFWVPRFAPAATDPFPLPSPNWDNRNVTQLRM